MKFRAVCLLVTFLLYVDSGECRTSNSFTKDDLGEIFGIAGYFFGRFALTLSAREAQKVQADIRKSPYVDSAYNMFSGERVLTNKMINEAVGDSCYYIRKHQGKSRRQAKEFEEFCQNSPYAKYDWEMVYDTGKLMPEKELVEQAVGDACFQLAILNGRTKQRAKEFKEECHSSHYVDYIYNALNKNIYKPDSRLISEVFGDVCYLACKLPSRQDCLTREDRCEKTEYVDLLYNLAQRKNRFTNQVVDKIVYDVCYWWTNLVNGSSDRQSRTVGRTCKRHEMTIVVKSILQPLAMKFWPLEAECDPYYDDAC